MNTENMNPAPTCPNCNARLNESSDGSPCPACLMQLGMQAWAGADATRGMPTEGRYAPTQGSATSANIIPEELVAAFPQLEILHLVGEGGMGSVYCARQKALNRLVALKVIKPTSSETRDFAERFLREAQTLGQLSHPNIVTVYDFGQNGDLYYFLMEYVDGINLRQMLFGGKLQPSQALAIVPAICDALQYAHDKGVVHRDIKPENILVDTQGKIKIADFGLAKILNKKTVSPTLTQAHQVMGTMHYMAPEQFERPRDVDHRADIYSLGVVIYELLTGELPLGRFASPSDKARVDVRLDEVVMQTLAKEPELRYQQVSKVKTDIESIAYNAPAPAPASRPAAQPAVAPFAPAPPVKQYAPYPGHTQPASRGVGPFPQGNWLLSMLSPQTYTNWIYLFLSFPLGLIYFIFMIVGLSVGIGTVIVWIGLFILLGTFLLARGLTTMERAMMNSWLKTSIHPRQTPNYEQLSIIGRTGRLFFESRTWMSVLYLIVKFPLGILSLVASILYLAVPISFIASPFLIQFRWYSINVGAWHPESSMEIFFFPLIGVILAVILANLVNGLAWLHAAWGRLCLG